MLTAEEWNERYPNGTPVLCVAVCGPRPTVGYAPSLAASQDEFGTTRIRTWTHGAFWRDDHVGQVEPLATDAERLAAGWLDPERAQALLDAARAWVSSRSIVEEYNMDDDEIRLETVVNAFDTPDTVTPC